MRNNKVNASVFLDVSLFFFFFFFFLNPSFEIAISGAVGERGALSSLLVNLFQSFMLLLFFSGGRDEEEDQ